MIKITSRGIPELQAWLKSLAQNVKRIASEAVAEYLVGDESHGLKHYPPYQHITVKQAYGGFVSDKQRRYVMARINEGSITPGVPHRTGELQRGWEYKAQGSRYAITNSTQYAQYVVGGQQANMQRLIGWRLVWQNIQDNLKGAYRHAQAQVKAWLKAHPKG